MGRWDELAPFGELALFDGCFTGGHRNVGYYNNEETKWC